MKVMSACAAVLGMGFPLRVRLAASENHDKCPSFTSFHGDEDGGDDDDRDDGGGDAGGEEEEEGEKEAAFTLSTFVALVSDVATSAAKASSPWVVSPLLEVVGGAGWRVVVPGFQPGR
mmetsp:Transcript_19905/g.40886  ORF Transcript_19905/g.40886 Transcript_19905/m.40886 type:complete len:118 (-) Transcript_19905:1088-1441(-)